jgi:hypothetical protein
MEDLIKNDATFEVYHNSEGGQLLNNRVLLSYPSEKSSFQVDLGFDGDATTGTTDGTKTGTTDAKPKATYDPEKLAQGVTATAGAISSVGSTIQAFKGSSTGTKAPSRRKALKEVCGKKPLLKKNRGTYDKCVADYNAGKTGGSTSTKAPDSAPTTTQTEETPPPNNTKKIVIGLVVVGVLVTAFIGYKKGWFGKKAG